MIVLVVFVPELPRPILWHSKEEGPTIFQLRVSKVKSEIEIYRLSLIVKNKSLFFGKLYVLQSTQGRISLGLQLPKLHFDAAKCIQMNSPRDMRSLLTESLIKQSLIQPAVHINVGGGLVLLQSFLMQSAQH